MALLGISTFLLRTPGLHTDFRPATPGSQVSVAGSYHAGFVQVPSAQPTLPQELLPQTWRAVGVGKRQVKMTMQAKTCSYPQTRIILV